MNLESRMGRLCERCQHLSHRHARRGGSSCPASEAAFFLCSVLSQLHDHEITLHVLVLKHLSVNVSLEVGLYSCYLDWELAYFILGERKILQLKSIAVAQVYTSEASFRLTYVSQPLGFCTWMWPVPFLFFSRYRKLALKWHPDKNPENKEEP